MTRSRIAVFFAAGLACVAPLRAQVWEVGNHLLTLPGGDVADTEFGRALVTGDFDGDGDDDLVVRSNLASGNGRIDLYLGSASGLAAPAGGSVVATSAYMGFGFALAAGDFDTDPADELAVGVPFATVTVGKVSLTSAGAVRIYDWNGSAWALAATFTQATVDVPGGAEQDDWFGFALAAGDFDHDGFDDLAIGVPSEAVGALEAAGAVNVLYGASGGLGTAGAQIWHRDGGNIAGAADDFSSLGWALAAGDFDSDNVDDLAIAIPNQTVDAVSGTGEVVVLFGIESIGLASADQQDLDPTDLGEDAEGQSFGSSLAAGDINSSIVCAVLGTCADDLVVGAPETDVLEINAGKVWVIGGSESANGLDPAQAHGVQQGLFDPFNTTLPEVNDNFGQSLTVGPLDATRGADVVIGSPNEAFESVQQAGCVHAVSGGSVDLGGNPFQFFYARSGLAAAPAALENNFGDSLAIGDFDHDGWGDLAIGVPGRTMSGQNDAGAVQVLYGALFADGFGRGDESAWVVP